MKKYQQFIGGAFVEPLSGKHIEVLNPYTQEVMATWASARESSRLRRSARSRR